MSKSKKKLIALAAAAVPIAAVGAAGAVTAVMMKKNFNRGTYPEKNRSTHYWYDPDYIAKHPRLNVEFESGKNTLQGYIYGLENENPKALLVFAHGIGVGHEMYINSLMWFVERGYLLFTYDATGSCTSDGSGTIGLVQSALDLDSALTYAEHCERFEGLPVVLLGHSWGGYAVGAVQNFNHSLTAACTISGYADPLEMLELGAEITTQKPGFVKSMHPFIWGYNKAMFGPNSALNAVDGINRSNVPTLIMHGELDAYVDYRKVSILSRKEQITNPNVEYCTLTGPYANHEDIWRSEKANDYLKAFREKIDDLKKTHSGEALEQALDEAYAAADKTVTNEPNAEMLGQVDAFYSHILESA